VEVGDSQGETWRRGSNGSNIIGGTDVDELAINELAVVPSFRSQFSASTTTPIIGFDRWSITVLPARLTARWRFFRLTP
jgi:hypothetical protein